MKTYNPKTMSTICDICGKHRGIKGIHVECSKKRKAKGDFMETVKNEAKLLQQNTHD